jgi:UDP-2-acetamido-3-amino-2,3-dideoxy-glucuronate N-acetyltransferase
MLSAIYPPRHHTAVVHEDASVGKGTTIGPFCEIGPKAVIGDNCRLEHCTVEGNVGCNTKVWRYSHVMEGAVVGHDCQVCNGAIVLTDAVVGNRTDMQLWTSISRLAKIGSDVFIGPNVVLCNSKNPRRGVSLQKITIGDGASIGANSSILAGVTIGNNAVIGAGSVVTHDIPCNVTAYGNPAKVVE